MRILLIEDDVMLRKAYVRTLLGAGYDVVTSLDEREVFRLIPEVDFVLSDYNMGLNFRAIANLATGLGKPFLVCSGSDVDILYARLYKPCSKEEMLDKIIEVIGTTKGQLKERRA